MAIYIQCKYVSQIIHIYSQVLPIYIRFLAPVPECKKVIWAYPEYCVAFVLITTTLTSDYRRTSLKGPMQVFDKFLQKLESSWKGNLMEESGRYLVCIARNNRIYFGKNGIFLVYYTVHTIDINIINIYTLLQWWSLWLR
jgi:hypothetical protein